MDFTQSGVDSLVYMTYFGGSDSDIVRQLKFDNNGHVLLTGYTLSADFPITYDACQGVAGGNGDAFVSVINPWQRSAFLVYSTFLGGGQSDVGYDVIPDATGSLLVTGYTLSPDFPMTYDAPQPRFGGGTEVFVAKVQPGAPGLAGLEFSTYLGTEGLHVAKGIAVASNGTVYVAGFTNLGLPSVGASALLYGGGTRDGFFSADAVGRPSRRVPFATMHSPRVPRGRSLVRRSAETSAGRSAADGGVASADRAGSRKAAHGGRGGHSADHGKLGGGEPSGGARRPSGPTRRRRQSDPTDRQSLRHASGQGLAVIDRRTGHGDALTHHSRELISADSTFTLVVSSVRRTACHRW